MWGIKMQLTHPDFTYLGRCLEGFFFGLYSGIFALYLQYHASKKGTNNAKQNIVFYALCVLYLLSMAVIAIDIAGLVIGEINKDISTFYYLEISQIPIFGCCDFIAQSILIHRCWIVWDRNTRVVIIPSILAFAYLVMWLANAGAFYFVQGGFEEATWGDTLGIVSLTASMAVNALVTGLIVVRIFKVFRQVKGITTSTEKSVGITGGSELRSIIFVIIESGITLFIIQFARLVIGTITTFQTDVEGASDAYTLIASIHEMLNGITPTIILVRVSMGLSFHNEPSFVEAIGSLQFAADSPNALPGAGSISQDGSLYSGLDDPDAFPEMENIIKEGREDDSGRKVDIQILDR